MQEWNVVITVRQRCYEAVIQALESYGWVDRTEFFNVMTMAVADTRALLEALREKAATEPQLLQCIAHVVPVSTRFVFQTPEEFESKAKQAIMPWVSSLSGRRFHVRMHRRGFKGRLSSQAEEKFLAHFLLKHLVDEGATAAVDFENPDLIIAVETVGQQAGLSLWTREDLHRYPFLHLT